MRRGDGIRARRHIDEQGALVVVDFRGCDSHGVSAVYQAFALLCARGKVSDALLKAGDEDADAHYALRDTLVTVARVAGIPLRFRLALVASSGPIENVYRNMQRELRSLGCDARIFRESTEARQWLCGAGLIPAPEGAAPRFAGFRIPA
jgi:hypothetical protein